MRSSGAVSEAAGTAGRIVAGRAVPVLDSAALHGLAGETVRVLEPVTEAARAAVLITALTIFGTAVGPDLYVLADGARHTAHLFAAIVGKTARARKGTSYRVTRRVLEHADPGLFAARTFAGFGSGEALIEAVGGGEEVDAVGDDGSHRNAPPRPPHDARALIVEEEFARILRVAERDGSTLSPIIRQAWDDGDLSVITRKKPVRAQGAHISILAHVTEEELLARLRGLELANGFGNRFLFCLVERSKRIPDGHGLDRDEEERLGREWRRRFEQARQLDGLLKRTRDADELWRDFYLSLDDDRPGMLGALLARAEAHVLRLSLVYALADGEDAIDLPHLRAALAVWDYSERSAFTIFGDAVGDPVADLILRRLRDVTPDGLTRTEIWNDVLARHERQTTVQAAFDLLESRSLAYCVRDEQTGGRPAERWYATSSGEESERGRTNQASFATSASFARKQARPEAASNTALNHGQGDSGRDQESLLRGSCAKPHLGSAASGGDRLHGNPAEQEPGGPRTTAAELRRWIAGEETS
jgi:hypothetical protein